MKNFLRILEILCVLPILGIVLTGCVEIVTTMVIAGVQGGATQAVASAGANAAANAPADKGKGVVFQPEYSIKSPVALAIIDRRLSQTESEPITEKESEKIRQSWFPYIEWNDRFTVEEFAWRIEAGLGKTGATVTRINTAPGDETEAVLMNSITDEATITITYVFHDLGIELEKTFLGSKYRIHWDVEISIFDQNGGPIASKHSRDEEMPWIQMEWFGWIGKAVERMQAKFDELYSDPTISIALEIETLKPDPEPKVVNPGKV